jgi:carboxymethylenebutenolidase
MATTRSERIRSQDGHEVEAHLALPRAGSGPGLVVVQEIFGVNDYIKEVCERLAGLGYVALAPDLYSRLERGVAIEETSLDELQRALGYMQRLDWEKAVDDTIAALEHLHRLPEVTDRKAGVIGFCLGGGIAYFVAARSDPDVAVCYYGSAIPDALGEAGQISCPILFHFGLVDGYISDDKRERVRQAFGHQSGVEYHEHPGAGHAFDNPASMFNHAEAAARAWQQTTDFLHRELPVGADGRR